MKILSTTIFSAIAVVLFFSTGVAQTPNQFIIKRPHGYMFPPVSKSNLAAGIDYPKNNNNAPCLNRQNTLGGSGDDFGDVIIPTLDGGFMICGGTNSDDGDFRVPAANGSDAFIARYDKSRKLEWTKTVGGTGDDYFNDIVQTFDGGFIAVGYTSSTDGNVTGNHGNDDVWVVKFSASGDIQWQKCYGGSGFDFGDGVVQNFFGGYTVAGFSNSTDGDVSGVHGDFDAWVIQIGPRGNLISQHCYGGSGFDAAYGIINSGDGNFTFVGVTYSNDGDVSGNHGGADAWVVKSNLSGKIIWQKAVGGSGDEGPSNDIVRTTDGNVVIDGGSPSPDGDINARDTVASFMTKLNSSTGDIIWSKSYAKPGERGGFGVFATADGGTVETGGVGVLGNLATFDVLISKFDANGKEEWYKTFGGSNYDVATDGGYESPNGSLNILCNTSSTDGDIKKYYGGIDTWSIKLGPCGEIQDEDADTGLFSNVMGTEKNSDIHLSNYPNPTANSTTISFSIPQSQRVTVQIFDQEGRLINTIAYAQMDEGPHQFTWNAAAQNGAAVAPGIYYVKLIAGDNLETEKISVLK